MEQNNKEPRQYSGTKGLSLAIVVGVGIGTVIGKLMDNMQTGLMIGLVLAVCGWALLFNRKQSVGDGKDGKSKTENNPNEQNDTPDDS